VAAASGPLDPDRSVAETLEAASKLYEEYLKLAELACLPDADDDLAAWSQVMEWGESPLELTAPSDLPLSLVYCSGE
jgi:hypothetical protein